MKGEIMEDNKLCGEFSAKVWAEEFVRSVKIKPEIATDEGTMLGWFANAIMAGYDKANQEKSGSIEKVGVEDKRTLIKIRTSDNAHSFINWSYDWREIPKLCKKAKEELYNQLLILADKVKKEKKEKE